MSLNFSTKYLNETSIVLNKTFINDYMPDIPSEILKVYLFTLYECNIKNENWLNDTIKTLNISREDVINAFRFLEEQGIVQINDIEEPSVTFLEIDYRQAKVRYRRGKFSDFNKQIAEIIKTREFTTTELNECYSLIETYNLEPSGLIMIIKYCMDIKDKNISFNYISKVAKSWAENGLTSVEKIEKELSGLTKQSKQLTKLFKALKITRAVEDSDNEYFEKWTTVYEYDFNSILLIAKCFSNIKSIKKFDTIMQEFFEEKVYSPEQIELYAKTKIENTEIAIMVNEKLSNFDGNLSNVVNVYVKPWLQLGYSKESLLLIAEYCYKNDRKSLTLMDDFIVKLHHGGLVNDENVTLYIENLNALREKVATLFIKNNIDIAVTSTVLSSYNTWTHTWNFSEEIVDHALSLASGMDRPIAYVNQILSNWKANNIDTLEKAKAFRPFKTDSNKATKFVENANNRNYSEEELKEFETDIKDVKL